MKIFEYHVKLPISAWPYVHAVAPVISFETDQVSLYRWTQRLSCYKKQHRIDRCLRPWSNSKSIFSRLPNFVCFKIYCLPAACWKGQINQFVRWSTFETGPNNRRESTLLQSSYWGKMLQQVLVPMKCNLAIQLSWLQEVCESEDSFSFVCFGWTYIQAAFLMTVNKF